MAAFLQRLMGRRAAPGWLAVELGETSVSLAHVVPNGVQPSVEFAEERSWDAADPKALERIAREFGAKRFQCTTLLKPQQYQILLVEAPAVKREELKAAVRWRIKDLLDYHIDDATIDVLDVPVPAAAAAQRAHYMYTVAARNDAIRPLIERFAAAGMPLAVIDIPDTAQRNLAGLREGARAAVALTLDANGGLITVSHAGELYLSRRLEITDAQLTGASAEGLARLHERVLIEMRRSLDHCERTYPFFTLGRVLLGPLADDGALGRYLAANLYLPVETLELGQLVRLPVSAASWGATDKARWLKLIGAGLRVEKKAL